MRIQPINIMCKPNKPCFAGQKRGNADRTVTVTDLYEMEDRINQRLDKQDEAIAKGLWYTADALTFHYNDDDSSQTLKRMKLHSNVCDSLVRLNPMEDINDIRFGQ